MYRIFLAVCFVLFQAAQYSYAQPPAVSFANVVGRVGKNVGAATAVGVGSKSSTADALTVVTPGVVVSQASATATSGKKKHPPPHKKHPAPTPHHKKPGCYGKNKWC